MLIYCVEKPALDLRIHAIVKADMVPELEHETYAETNVSHPATE